MSALDCFIVILDRSQAVSHGPMKPARWLSDQGQNDTVTNDKMKK